MLPSPNVFLSLTPNTIPLQVTLQPLPGRSAQPQTSQPTANLTIPKAANLTVPKAVSLTVPKPTDDDGVSEIAVPPPTVPPRLSADLDPQELERQIRKLVRGGCQIELFSTWLLVAFSYCGRFSSFFALIWFEAPSPIHF